MPFGLFCAGPSMSQNLLMKCELGMPSPVNCIQSTAGQPPFDDYNARCYEASPMSGQAACAKDGTAYPLMGKSFPLPAGSDDPALPETPSLTASAGVQTTYPAPANLTRPPPSMPMPIPTSLPVDFSSLPKASMPAYVTTVTIGTKTAFHTIYSNCGNGTMLFGTAPATKESFAPWQTGSIPGYLPKSQFSSVPSPPPSPVPNTVPCDEATPSSETSTVSWAVTPTETTADPSWAHPTDYATVTATSTTFIWASGDVSSASRNATATSSTRATEYPAASSGGFSQGEIEAASSSAASREVRAPSFWFMGAALLVVVVWGC